MGGKRICYVNPATLLRRPIAEIISRLSKEHEVALLIPKALFKPLDNSLHYSKQPKNVRVYTYSIVQLPGSYEWPIPITPMFFVQLFRVFRKYDTIHMWAHFYLANLFVALFAILFRKKLIMSMDTVAGYSFSSGRRYDEAFRLYYRLLGWLIFGAPKTIHLYGKSLKKFAKKAGINLEKTRVIPTGMEQHKFDGVKGDIRGEFGIKRDEVVLLYVGLLVPRKGIDIILKTLKKLRSRRYRMVIVGDGPHREEFENLARKLKLEKRVIFTGFRRDIGRILNTADLLFFPSRGEGLAGAIMESMSVGLPIVSSRIPCTIDLVKEGVNGYLCRITDTGCYAERLDKLIRNAELRQQLGSESKRLIKKFSWDKTIKELMKLY